MNASIADVEALAAELRSLRGRVEQLERLEDPRRVTDWTPALAGSSTAGVLSYDTNGTKGRAYRIGRLVFASAQIIVTGISTAPVGVLRLTGLPWTVGATVMRGGSLWLNRNYNYSSDAKELVIYPEQSETFAVIAETRDNLEANFVVAGNLTTSTGIYALLVYEAAT